jgi:hypothetical protein
VESLAADARLLDRLRLCAGDVIRLVAPVYSDEERQQDQRKPDGHRAAARQQPELRVTTCARSVHEHNNPDTGGKVRHCTALTRMARVSSDPALADGNIAGERRYSSQPMRTFAIASSSNQMSTGAPAGIWGTIAPN